MTSREKGFLLLSSHLGNPDRKPLTVPQLRTLAERVRSMKAPDRDRELIQRDLIALGYGKDMALRIISLLDDEAVLEYCLKRGRKLGCTPVTRVSAGYPLILRKRLGLDSPGCLWAKGDLTILDSPAIALVGSRELAERNRTFAEEVGRQAAAQGLTLVSGNARGADKTAQNACLKAGGKVISIVADSLADHDERENVLYLSEDSFDAEFSAQRALSRNRVIHALGRMVFVAQSSLRTGGTWDGTVKNLRFNWSPVCCYDDGSEAAAQLGQMGAFLVGVEALRDIGALSQIEYNFLDR